MTHHLISYRRAYVVTIDLCKPLVQNSVALLKFIARNLVLTK